MGRRAKPFPDGTIERMEELLAGDLPRRQRERVVCVRLLAMGRRGRDVALITGRSLNTVERHKRLFLAQGEDYLLINLLGGRRNEVLSIDEEAELMAGLVAEAEEGQIVTAAKVKTALEAKAGRPVGGKTVYRVMHRNGWRKVVPRPTHPDASPERRAAFKETSPA